MLHFNILHLNLALQHLKAPLVTRTDFAARLANSKRNKTGREGLFIGSFFKYEITKQSCLHPAAQPLILVAWSLTFQDDKFC